MEIIKSARDCRDCGRKNCFVNKHSSEEWKSFFTENKTTYRIQPGEKIFTEGDLVKGAYTVYSGYIKVYYSSEKTEKIVDIVTTENLLGYRDLGKVSTVYSVTAEAITECEITFFSVQTLRLAIEANKELAFYIINLLADKLKKTESKLKKMHKMSAKDKVICALNEIITDFGTNSKDETQLNFSPSRKDLAALATTTYETVIRVLSELDKNGHLKIDGKTLRILNKAFFTNSVKQILA